MSVFRFVLACLYLVGSLPVVAVADEFADLRQRWLTTLVGDGSLSISDADYQVRLDSVRSRGLSWQSSLNRDANRAYLWSQYSDWNRSATLSSNFNAIKAMALAYATPGQAAYHDTALGNDISAALDWLNSNQYNANTTQYDNWWDWQIGSPLLLNDILVLMGDRLTSPQRSAWLATLDRHCPDPTYRTSKSSSASSGVTETGANRLDKALIVAVRGAVGNSSSKLLIARDAISQPLLLVKSGDGFYQDGSFIQHDKVAYTGSYGVVLLQDFANLFYLLDNSSWSVVDNNRSNVYRWVHTAFAPWMVNGAMSDVVRGRAVSRMSSADIDTGRSVRQAVLRLSQTAPSSDKDALQRLVKTWIAQDKIIKNLFDTQLFDMGLLKKLVADTAVSSNPNHASTHIFASMDRVVHQRTQGAAVIALFSPRISAFESGNGENLKAWYSGNGMLLWYNTDLNYYNDNYWSTIDWRRLPGITHDYRQRSFATPTAWKNYHNPRNWVGGAAHQTLASIGMEFSHQDLTGSDLQGKKSWFLVDDVIVAVGSSIRASSGYEVETVVDNRKLSLSGDETVLIDGQTVASGFSSTPVTTAATWLHIDATQRANQMAYVFPQNSSVQWTRETRSGAWNQINSGGSSTAVSRHYFVLSLPHGVNPNNAGYRYFMLPGRSASETSAFAQNNTIRFIQHDDSLHAIDDRSRGLVLANFWRDALTVLSVDGKSVLSSNKKAAVVLQQVEQTLTIAVADPTQTQTAMTVEWFGKAEQVLSKDAAITVIQTQPTVQLQINPQATAGKSLKISLRLPLPPIDTDQDGLSDEIDNDDDNDGVLDLNDAFPRDANESRDIDRDGTGDNADQDDDNDGVVDADDQFPLDRDEQQDYDSDSIGDNADDDDDNDGVNDSADAFSRDRNETIDSDRDGIGNNSDNDDDNDAVNDNVDALPLNPNESRDFDRDGVGDNADSDDDNDAVNDDADALPLNPNESRDFDHDGVGDNADSDDDNDGYADQSDAFPFDATRWQAVSDTPQPQDPVTDEDDKGRGGGGSVPLLLSGLLGAVAWRRQLLRTN